MVSDVLNWLMGTLIVDDNFNKVQHDINHDFFLTLLTDVFVMLSYFDIQIR